MKGKKKCADGGKVGGGKKPWPPGPGGKMMGGKQWPDKKKAKK